MTAPGDRFLRAPFVLALIWPLALVLTHAGSFTLFEFGAPLVLLGWGFTALCALPIAIDLIWRRSWRRVASTLVFPLSAAIAWFHFDTVWSAAFYAGEVVHVWFLSPEYLREASKLPADRHPALLVFALNDYDGVYDVAVYDENDEIAKPKDERSEEWTKKAGAKGFGCDLLRVVPAGGHLYVARSGMTDCR